MSLNFFNTACQEPPLTDTEFGICDDGFRAYTSRDDRTKWIATVKNRRGIRLLFTAVDKCIIKDHEYPGRGRCDGMLTSEEHLYLIELKDSDWATQTSAREQLISTIQFLREHHPGMVDNYRYKKAFVCNKRRPFYVMGKEDNKSFYQTYGFRLDVQAQVVVV